MQQLQINEQTNSQKLATQQLQIQQQHHKTRKQTTLNKLAEIKKTLFLLPGKDLALIPSLLGVSAPISQVQNMRIEIITFYY